MDPAHELLSIDVVREVNRIPYAQMALIDGDAAQRRFAASDSGFFDPGKQVEIKLRHEGDAASEEQVFSGLVVSHSLQVEHAQSVLTVELKDKAVKLAQIPVSMVFADQSDDELIGKLISNHGLQKGNIAATKPRHERIVQYCCTDWDFMVSRAEVNGLLVCVLDGAVSLGKLELGSGAKRVFEFGIDEIYSFEIEASATGQLGEVSSIAWDLRNQQMSSPSKAKGVSLAPGDLDGKKLADAVGAGKRMLTNPVLAGPDELQAWADAALARSRLSLIRGRISVPGVSGIKLLDVIELKGVGQHFNGKALLTGWRHRVTNQGWITDLRFGLHADWFASRPDVAAQRACGLLPPISGLQIGIVDTFEDDPEKQFRVKVKVPSLGDQQPAIWARLISPDAGKGRGFFFRPEKGDEVVLGFFNEDPRQPVIVGAMYGSTNTPPKGFEALSEKNELKGLLTRAGTLIGFADKDQGKASVYIETANKNRILLDDEAETVSLADQHGNVITMDENGVTIESIKDIRLKAAGKLAVKCDEDAVVESGGKSEIKSGADLKLEASGKTEIKGSSVDVK